MNSLSPIAQTLAGRGVAFAPAIAQAAQRHGLDPVLLAAVAAQETGGPGSNSGHNIVGDGGHGHGLFQIDDRWHAFARTRSAMDPASNAEYAARMIRHGLDIYGGDVHKALSAYNSGSPNSQGSTTTWGDGRTLGYADSVLRHYARLGGPAAAAARRSSQTPPTTCDGGDANGLLDELIAERSQANSLSAFSPASVQIPAPQTGGVPATGSGANAVRDRAPDFAGLIFSEDGN